MNRFILFMIIFLTDQLARIAPAGTSALLLQCIAAPLGGCTTVLLTNPLDIVRARLQVSIVIDFLLY